MGSTSRDSRSGESVIFVARSDSDCRPMPGQDTAEQSLVLGQSSMKHRSGCCGSEETNPKSRGEAEGENGFGFSLVSATATGVAPAGEEEEEEEDEAATW